MAGSYSLPEKIFYALLFAGLLAVAAYQQALRLLPDPEFYRGLEGYSSSPGSATPVKNAQARKSDGEWVVEAKGPTNLIVRPKTYVDASKLYRGSVRVRTLNAKSGTQMLAGVLQFDKSGQLLAEKAQLVFFKKMIAVPDGWVEGEGIVQLSPEVTFIRPVAILNHSAPGAVSQIDYLRLEQIQ